MRSYCTYYLSNVCFSKYIYPFKTIVTKYRQTSTNVTCRTQENTHSVLVAISRYTVFCPNTINKFYFLCPMIDRSHSHNWCSVFLPELPFAIFNTIFRNYIITLLFTLALPKCNRKVRHCHHVLTLNFGFCFIKFHNCTVGTTRFKVWKQTVYFNHFNFNFIWIHLLAYNGRNVPCSSSIIAR